MHLCQLGVQILSRPEQASCGTDVKPMALHALHEHSAEDLS